MMKNLTFEELWQSGIPLTNIGVFGTSTPFFLEEVRQCVNDTIMISGFFPLTEIFCSRCGSNAFAVHRNNRYAHARMPTVNGRPTILRYRRSSLKCRHC